MPPRFAYWTILAGGLPTSFRAADKDELMPTFRRLKDKHPDAEMKYFARGKLWESPEQARLAASPKAPERGRDWRPGGNHRDPRQRFKDAKKARNQDRRQERWERKTEDRRDVAPKTRPHGDPLAPRPDRRTVAKGSRQGDAARSYRDNRLQTRQRPFRTSRDRPLERNQEAPARPPRPQREPPPDREPKPDPPPRPSEPMIKPPGPPERGRPANRRDNRHRRRRQH